jgi:hypothetical protein
MGKVMIHLTLEQADLLHQESEPRIFDPTTQTVYIAVRSELYERVREWLEDAEEQESWQKLADRGRASFLEEDSSDK